MRSGNRVSSYARRVEHIDAPKAVWMAIAFSLAQRITEDNSVAAVAEVLEEWRILHAQGIVAQPVRINTRIAADQ